MRRRRRNRATWFPVLGFANGGGDDSSLSTVDVRNVEVSNQGGPNVLAIPIIPDIDINPDTGQLDAGGSVTRTLRDFVEGQSCLIERIVGTIQAEMVGGGTDNTTSHRVIVCAAIAVLPTSDSSPGDPAIPATEFNPLSSENSAQPWMWRRVWVLGNPGAGTGGPVGGAGLPQNNNFGSLAEGCKIDTKGTRRVIRREERIFLIYSFLDPFPANGGDVVNQLVNMYADVRVIGGMRHAKNRSQFK